MSLAIQHSDPREIYRESFIAALKERYKDLPLSACQEIAQISINVIEQNYHKNAG